MNGYNFTERVRKVLMRAREEAKALNHEYVGTEHILLGLCAGGGVAEHTLRNLGVDPAAVRENVLQLVTPGQADGSNASASTPSGILEAIADTLGVGRQKWDLPYTSRAKKTLELAMTEARELNHMYVGTEHLLLGLMREERGIGAQVLTSMGMTLTGLRDEVLRLLGTEMSDKAQGPTIGKGSIRIDDQLAAITLVVEHPDGRIEAKKFHRPNEAVKYLNGLEY